MTPTPEQEARELLDRIGVPDAERYSAGDLVELANLLAELDDDAARRWSHRVAWGAWGFVVGLCLGFVVHAMVN
jgi:hypothetical protein